MRIRPLVVLLCLPLAFPASSSAQSLEATRPLRVRSAPAPSYWPIAFAPPPNDAPLLRDYIAVTADGRMFSDDRLQWRSPNQLPLLGELDLCGELAARLLLSRVAAATAAAGAWVELHNGDFLPGQVERFTAAVDEAPACLQVRIPDWLEQPFRDAPPARVRMTWVRRIVRRRVADHYAPKTLWLADGRRLSWFAIRWAADSVTCLTDQGRSTHALSDIAELHLPRREDVWDTVLEELRELSSDVDAILVEAEIPDALRVTAAIKSARPFAPRPDAANEDWAVSLQPIWAVEPIWVRPMRVKRWRFFPARVVPLTRLHRIQGDAPSVRCRSNSDLRGDVLCDALDQPAPWGWACQAPAVLSFAAPPLPAQLVSGLALDGRMGDGGCVQGEIAWNDAAAPAAVRTAVLSGRGRRHDELGPIRLDEAVHSIHLRLNATPPDAPPGSDEGDLRDAANWLSPRVELDGW